VWLAGLQMEQHILQIGKHVSGCTVSCHHRENLQSHVRSDSFQQVSPERILYVTFVSSTESTCQSIITTLFLALQFGNPAHKFAFQISYGDIALSNIHLQSQLRVFIDVFFTISLTTCFGPFGPSSGESQYILFSHTFPENYRYLNESVVLLL
jgi:hypothetical protein